MTKNYIRLRLKIKTAVALLKVGVTRKINLSDLTENLSLLRVTVMDKTCVTKDTKRDGVNILCRI